MNLMLKSVYAELDGETPPILVDLGYWSEEAAQRYEALLAVLPKRRFQLLAHRRLFAEIPPNKAATIMARFPIVEGSTYWRATHHWLEPCVEPDAWGYEFEACGGETTVYVAEEA
jgi:hypothetical protein